MNCRNGCPRCPVRPLSNRGAWRGGQPGSCSRCLPHVGFPKYAGVYYKPLPLLCPPWGDEMRIIAIVTALGQGHLAHISETTTPPELAPARGPPGLAEAPEPFSPLRFPLSGWRALCHRLAGSGSPRSPHPRWPSACARPRADCPERALSNYVQSEETMRPHSSSQAAAAASAHSLMLAKSIRTEGE